VRLGWQYYGQRVPEARRGIALHSDALDQPYLFYIALTEAMLIVAMLVGSPGPPPHTKLVIPPR
jgi:hypothetical protein